MAQNTRTYRIILELSCIVRVSKLQCYQSEGGIVGVAAWRRQHCLGSVGTAELGWQLWNWGWLHQDGGMPV